MTRRPVRRPRLRLRALENRLAPNGTPVLIDDIDPGSGDSGPNSFAGMGGLVYFAASTGTAPSSTIGEELWKTDGTAAGTVLVDDIYPVAAACSSTAVRHAT